MPRFHSKEFPWYSKVDLNRREHVISAAKIMMNAAHTAQVTDGGWSMKYCFLAITVMILLLAPLAAFSKAVPKKVQKKMAVAIEREAQAQKKADDWSVSKEDLINEIRDLKTRVTWLQYQRQKHETYVQGLKDNISRLEAKKLEARKVREQLEPYLEEVVDRLEKLIAADLPFLSEERQQRLMFLRNTMNDYHLSLGEKLRRVFEALQVEATYGKMVTASEATLDIEGSETQVTIFRLGRVAMFYQSLDGEKIGRWNRETKKWEPLSKDFERDIRRALEMARRERSVQLIQLPLGAVKP